MRARTDQPELQHREQRRRPRTADSALLGAAAGLLGGVAMMVAMKMEQQALLAEEERMDPPPKKLAEVIARRQGVALSDTQAMAAGMAVHMGYSALWGAIYGVVQDRLHPPDLLHGLALGGLVYASNFPEWGLLPRLGVLPPPSEQNATRVAIPVISHAVFGVATAKAFEAMH
jgi:uncharacterized membrane protein YagU involved in acid resistance